jgi:hypothetical protein
MWAGWGTGGGGRLLIRVLVFCIVCTVSFYCFVYVHLFVFVLSVLVQGLLPPSDNSIAVCNKHIYIARVYKV